MESLPSGYPIRLSRARRICAPPPGFSQLITAFFVSQLLGIHHTPIIRLTILSFRLRISSIYSRRFKHSLHAATSKSCTQLVFPVYTSQPVSRSHDVTKTSLSFTYPFPVRDFLKSSRFLQKSASCQRTLRICHAKRVRFS